MLGQVKIEQDCKTAVAFLLMLMAASADKRRLAEDYELRTANMKRESELLISQ